MYDLVFWVTSFERRVTVQKLIWQVACQQANLCLEKQLDTGKYVLRHGLFYLIRCGLVISYIDGLVWEKRNSNGVTSFLH